MGILEWGKSPWGQDIPIHISFFLLWVSAIGGLVFLVVHAIWLRYFAKPDVYAWIPLHTPSRPVCPKIASTLAARLFHWIARRCSPALYRFFLPKVGINRLGDVPLDNGLVLPRSLHIIAASGWTWSFGRTRRSGKRLQRPRRARAVGASAAPVRQVSSKQDVPRGDCSGQPP